MSSKRKPYQCHCLATLTANTSEKLCNQKFFTRAARDQHIEQAHGLVACIHTYCGRGFPTRETMMEHMRTTENHKHLVCRVCSAYASHGPACLLRHIIARHPEALTDEERGRHWCPECKKAFPKPYDHFADHHPELLPDHLKQSHRCDACGKYFKNLATHISVAHTKPFLCPIPRCPFRCGHIPSIRKHLMSRSHGLSRAETEGYVTDIRAWWAKRTGTTVRRNVRKKPVPQAVMNNHPTPTGTPAHPVAEHPQPDALSGLDLLSEFVVSDPGVGTPTEGSDTEGGRVRR